MLLFAGCKAFDRAQYQALLDAHPLDAATGPGACLARSSLDDGGCTLAVAPAAPSALEDRPGDGRTYTLVLRRVGIGPGSFGNWGSIGFDLDQRCTTPTSDLAAQSCRPAQIVADGEEGRDNAFGGVIATGLLVLRTLDERDVNTELGSGRLALGLRFTEWGGSDDRQMRVEWLVLTDGRAGTTDGGPLAWDGTDRWKIEPGFSFSSGTTPRAETSDAFVACDYSVARFSTRITIPMLSLGKLRMLTLDRAVLAGAFDPRRGGVSDLAGVWTRQSVIDALPWFDICPPPFGDRSVYEDRLDSISRSFDINSTLIEAPTSACNAASFGLRLEWAPVTVDGVASAPFPQENDCSTGATDGGAPVDP